MRYLGPSIGLPLALVPPSPLTRNVRDQFAVPPVPTRNASPGIAPSASDVRALRGVRRKDLRVGSVSDFMGSTFFHRGFQNWFQFRLDAPRRPHSAVDTYLHQIN